MSWTKFIAVVRAIWLAFVVTVNTIAALGLLVSAYSNMFSPETFRYGVVVVMTFPAWLAVSVVLLVLDLFFWRRTAIVIGIALLASIPQIREYSPVNIPHLPMSASEQKRSFTLMTYNVMQFNEFDETPGSTANPQMNYILENAPDVVCIEEASYLQPTVANRISQDQIDEMQRIYPYVYVYEDLALLSKFPAEPIPAEFPDHKFKSGHMAGWRLHIPDEIDKDTDELVVDSVDIMGGRIVNLFVVHLRSMAYSGDQRAIFREATDGRSINRAELREIKSELLPTLIEASYDRDAQTKIMLSHLAKFGGETAIVAGDFNDVAGCRSIQQLKSEADMKTVYSRVGFGPMVTYHANHFFFQIDHVLYRGRLKPYSLTRGDLKASDHYPLTVTFLLD